MVLIIYFTVALLFFSATVITGMFINEKSTYLNHINIFTEKVTSYLVFPFYLSYRFVKWFVCEGFFKIYDFIVLYVEKIVVALRKIYNCLEWFYEKYARHLLVKLYDAVHYIWLYVLYYVCKIIDFCHKIYLLLKKYVVKTYDIIIVKIMRLYTIVMLLIDQTYNNIIKICINTYNNTIQIFNNLAAMTK
jgi:hypothetical protein